MFTDVLILAGGSGERLWPASTNENPKQFMRLDGCEMPGGTFFAPSFLQRALRLAYAIPDISNIYIITRKNWVDKVAEHVSELAIIPAYKSACKKVIVMGEPFGRNTAPAIMWACSYIKSLRRCDEQGAPAPTRILMMASDHIIEPEDRFVHDALLALDAAVQNKLAAFGITPRGPETGYGYLEVAPVGTTEAGAAAESAKATPAEASAPVQAIISFKEKPDLATAQTYVDAGNYFWNSGLYAFRADFMIAQLEQHAPEVVAPWKQRLVAPKEILFTIQRSTRVMEDLELESIYDQSPSISIDYAVSEKTKHAVCVPAGFNWDDLGTWDSIANNNPKKVPGRNAAEIEVQSSNCYVRSRLPVALCGVEDLIVVVEKGQVLVCKKGESNLVKEALAASKASKDVRE